LPETDEPSSIQDQQPMTATPTVAPAPPAFNPLSIFIGRDGLRAGWGILLFVVLLEGLPYVVNPLVQAMFPWSFGRGGQIPPRAVFAFEGAGVLCVLAAMALLAKIEARPMSAYGFRPQRRAFNFFAGLITGVLLLSLLIACLRATGLLAFDTRLLFGVGMLRYGSIWLAGFFLVGLREELVSRGYLQFTLTRGLTAIYRRVFRASRAETFAFWTAALVLSVAFGVGHRTNPGESPLGLLSAGLAGGLLCLSLWRTGSLWWAIGFHASWDWAQSFLYGVADSGLMIQGRLFATHPVGRPYLSGGLTGPEGSILLLPVMAVGAAVILFALPRTPGNYVHEGAPPD
jgi:membrane protease YdiL (CAAX protease family)